MTTNTITQLRTTTMTYPIIRPAEHGTGKISDADIRSARKHLSETGFALFRGFDIDLDGFSDLTSRFCARVTFDPARGQSGDNIQKVDAGLGPIGLHIENGNTPVRPDLVAFYCRRAAFEGSQTTLCDGARLFELFDDRERCRWSQTMTVRRTLPEALWKRYLADEHPALSSPDQVRMEHLLQFQAFIPGQQFDLRDDGSLNYALDVLPVTRSRLSDVKAFANAILGPSHNYEPPTFTLADGSRVSHDEIEALRDRAEGLTTEVNWQDGDVAVIDNARVMHGRRAIVDPERELFIGMGRI
jgi:hypothetical protein